MNEIGAPAVGVAAASAAMTRGCQCAHLNVSPVGVARPPWQDGGSGQPERKWPGEVQRDGQQPVPTDAVDAMLSFGAPDGAPNEMRDAPAITTGDRDSFILCWVTW